MIDLEGSLLRRWKGLRIVAVSFGLGLIGVLPLLAYIAFGPKDGNPIGLGLLAVLAVPIAMIGVLVGLIRLVVEAFVRERP
jgi:uncharacterized membrane-anchored protein